MKLLIQLVREILHLSGKSQGISNTYGCANHYSVAKISSNTVSSLGRRLRKKKNGTILTAGFQLPEHAAAEDFFPWVAHDKGSSSF